MLEWLRVGVFQHWKKKACDVSWRNDLRPKTMEAEISCQKMMVSFLCRILHALTCQGTIDVSLLFYSSFVGAWCFYATVMMFFSFSERQVVLFTVWSMMNQFVLPIELIARINPLVRDQISVTLIISEKTGLRGKFHAHPPRNGKQWVGQLVGFISQKRGQLV